MGLKPKLLLLCCIVSFAILVTEPFGPLALVLAAGKEKQTELVDRALGTIAMTRNDLSISPDLVAGPFALKLFSAWMKNPMMAPKKAQGEIEELYRVAGDPFLWFQKLTKFGDQRSVASIPSIACAEYRITAPFQLVEVIRLLLGAINTANIRLTSIRSTMCADDIKLVEKCLFRDFCEKEDSGKQAVEMVTVEELRQALETAKRIDTKGILEAGYVVLKALTEAKELLAQMDDWQSDVTSFSLRTGLGLVEIGGIGSDVHETPAALIIDLGGDDLYKGRVASGTDGKSSLVLDLSGDDIYMGKHCTQGAGVWGIGVLLDLEGNDLYRAASCAQGAAMFGIGLLIDGQGADNYLGSNFVQAAASFGWGGLIDLDGEDVYECEHSGQAYSEVLGISCLCDLEGNDKYISGRKEPDPREVDMNQSYSQGFATGIRGLAAGGFALLTDKSGNDFYQCQYFGQGASYWMSIGMLYDRNGNDTYIARRYAQGAGIHFSFGALLDVCGSDHTFSWGVSQGCGHDYGIGVLVNETGSDTYVSQWLSMGASEANGVGIFVDNYGNDGYETNAGIAVGHLIEERQAGGVGLFLDAGGNDRYSKKGENNSIWGANRWCVGLDNNDGGVSGINMTSDKCSSAASKEAQKAWEKERDHLLEQLARSNEMLFPKNLEAVLSVASHWGQEKQIPKEARERLLRLAPEESMPAMVNLVDTPNMMSLKFMETFFTVHAFQAINYLVRNAAVAEPVSKERTLYYLGVLKDPKGLESCIAALEVPSWRIRSQAIRSLGQILDKKCLHVLVPMRTVFKRAFAKGDRSVLEDYLVDEGRIFEVLSVLTRSTSVEYETYARYKDADLGREKGGDLREFVDLVFSRVERMLAFVEKRISDIRHSKEVAEKLATFLKDPQAGVRKATVYALGQIRYRPAIPELIGLLKDPNLWVRDAAVLSLALFGEEVISPLNLAMERQNASFKILALDVLGRIGND